MSTGAAPAPVQKSAQELAFDFQLDFLKLEFQSINEIIKRIDEITQTTKNWAVLIWAGSISLALGQPTLRKYLIFTAVLPLPFWFVDGWWRRIQRSCIYRTHRISDFLNGSNLIDSFKEQKLIDFKVLDVRGVQYKNLPDFQRFIRVTHTMLFKDVGGLYFPLALLSLIIGIAFILFPQLRN